MLITRARPLAGLVVSSAVVLSAIAAVLLAGVAHAAGGVSQAKANVKAAMQPTTRFSVPTTSLKTSKLKGKIVYYIPVVTQAPAFGITAQNLKQATAAVGMSLRVCNGGGNPSQISGCVDQAVGARAGAIIMDSIPYAEAQNSLDKAVAKKIPVLITDQIPPTGTKSTSKVAYLPGAITIHRPAADWMIADSNGKANVLINMNVDSPSTKAYINRYAIPEFKKLCTGCKVWLNTISAADYAKIPPSTSAALIKYPTANYFMPEFADSLYAGLQGLQQSNRAANMKIIVPAGSLAELRQLKAGGPVKAVIVDDTAYQAWADLDLAMRLMLGVKPEEYTVPSRLFTAANVGSVALTSGAAASGGWIGKGTYKVQFRKLWGV